jgi:YegS/Rv2252/BmrU family lipid kinase
LGRWNLELGTDCSALILNPAAGNGRAGREWPALAERLRAAGIAFRQMVTCGPGDATLLARRAIAEGAGRLIVVGGDGTLNEVVNGYLAGAGGAARDAPALALVPLGTGSDFARGLGISGEAAAIEVLGRGQLRPLDLGLATFRDARGREVTRAFANVADFGLGPETSEVIARGSKRLGPAAYLYGALRAIAAFAPTPLRVEVDGATVYEGPSGMAVVANGSYFGGGMQVAPRADLNDGAFDVLVLDRTSRRALVREILPRIYRGTHVDHPAVRQARGRAVTIAAERPFPLEVDGEIVGATPARFTIWPGALRVLVPEGKTG